MRIKSFSIFVITVLALVGFGAVSVQSQPSAAQVKKDVSGPKTISVTVHGAGTRVWSKGYSKFATENMAETASLIERRRGRTW